MTSPLQLLCQRLICFGVALALAPAPAPAAGGVVSDGSLGSGVVGFSGGRYSIPADAGSRAGGNLFHSFSTFSLTGKEAASFDGLSGIHTVLARVTGGDPSSINGAISCPANLFLVNPAGIVLGPKADVFDITGSLTLSTASFLTLGAGGKFFSRLGQGDVLASAPVSAFGFGPGAPAPIGIFGTLLFANPGASLHIIGGDLTLDGALLSTVFPVSTADSITLFSAGSAGLLPFSLSRPGAGYGSAAFSSGGKIDIRNGSVLDVAGPGPGRIVIRGGRLSLDGSQISGGATSTGASLKVFADSLSLTHNSNIASRATGSRGGGVAIRAGTAVIDGPFSFIATVTDTPARAGNLSILAGSLSLTHDSQVYSRTSGRGRGGDVTVRGGSVFIEGGFLSTQSDPGSMSRAGNLTLDLSGSLSLISDARITASTFGLGRAGNVRIAAASLSLDHGSIVSDSEPDPDNGAPALGAAGNLSLFSRGTIQATGGSLVSSSTFGPGAGGKVRIVAQGGITLRDRAVFVVGTQGTGAGGSIFVKTPDLLLDGTRSESAMPTGFIAQSKEQGDGPAGSVFIEAGKLTLLGGATIEATTGSANPGGAIDIRAGEILLDGHGSPLLPSGLPLATAISARTILGATGTGGSIRVVSGGNIILIERGEIESATEGLGSGGDVTVFAQNLTATGATFGFPSGILARGAIGSSGPAGSVTIDLAGDLRLSLGAQVSSNNLGLGPAGGIRLGVAGSISVKDASITVLAAFADAGDVVVRADSLSLLRSSLTAQAAGNGGNVTLGARFLTLETGLVTASAIAGDGGIITLEIPATGVLGDPRDYIIVSGFVRQSSDSLITASSELGVQGTLVIDAPEIDLSTALPGFDGHLIDAASRIQEQCAARFGLDFSSLLLLGRGGTTLSPEDPLSTGPIRRP